MINFAGGILLLGGGNLTRSDLLSSGRGMNLWWGGGGWRGEQIFG